MAKNKTTFKEDFQQHPVMFSFIFILLIIVAVVILLLNAPPLSEIWPTAATIQAKKERLIELQKELQKDLNELDKMQLDEASFLDHNADFWIDERDGNAKINVQKRINGAAARHQVALSSVGALRSDKIIDGVYMMTTSIRGEGSLKSVMEFIGELQGVQPRFYWQSIGLLPRSTKDGDKVLLTGAVQVIAIEDEKIIRLLIDKK